MNTTELRLSKAPIVEAVIDIDCDMPPSYSLADLEHPVLEKLRDQYPAVRRRYVHETEFEFETNQSPRVASRQGLRSLQFVRTDGLQIVQFRDAGYSFNRLAPYEGLDEYLPEIKRTWRTFVDLASPLRVKAIRLQYVNLLRLPLTDNQVDLGEYLRNAPDTGQERLIVTGFLSRISAMDTDSGVRANVSLAPQSPEPSHARIILEIEVFRQDEYEVSDWESIVDTLQILRRIKNKLFLDSITEGLLEQLR